MLKQLLPSTAKQWIKERATRLLGVPWNRFDVPISLTRYLPAHRPISLIDVGASQGDFTSSIERYCGLRQAMLIEPQPGRIAELKSRFRGSHFNFTCAAASSDSAQGEMALLNWDYSSSLLPLKRDLLGAYGDLNMGVREVIPVRVATLDEICEDFHGPVDLLKIDVQGAEDQVIKGATKTLQRVRIMWVEVSFKQLYEGSETVEGMNRLCNELGFVLTHLEEGWHSSENGELLQADALFVRGQETQHGA
jgi:FkbM family methyltransferase